VALAALALLAGCWDFQRLAGLHESAADAGMPPSDLARDLASDVAPDPARDLGTTTPPPPPGDLGGCVAQPLEDCHNDRDDDCDGHVNNGCPDHLALGAAHPLTPRGGSGGDGLQSLRCPADSFVVIAGLWGSDSNHAATGIEIRCATFSLAYAGGSYALVNHLLPGSQRIQAGNAAQTYKGFDANADCSASSNAAATWFTSHISTTNIVNPPVPVVAGLGAHCGLGALTPLANNRLDLTLTPTGNSDDDICYRDNFSYCVGSAYEDRCPAGEVLVGLDARLGELMDQVTAICAPLSIVYK
jgi:hypothetical protein